MSHTAISEAQGNCTYVKVGCVYLYNYAYSLSTLIWLFVIVMGVELSIRFLCVSLFSNEINVFSCLCPLYFH